jgi:transposase-like protein
MPRPYPPEFRQKALDLVRSGRSVVEVAKLLGIAESCLYRWKKQDLTGRGLKPAPESAELAAARRKIRDLEEENKILRKAAAAVEQVVPPKDRCRLVAELHADGVRVRRACYALGVSTSGFYDWKTRAPSARPVRHAWLTDLIGQAHDASCGTYGQPRVRAELQRTHGLVAGARGSPGSRCAAGPSGCRPRKQSPTWSSASSPRTGRTGSGSPASPSTPRGRARSTAVS